MYNVLVCIVYQSTSFSSASYSIYSDSRCNESSVNKTEDSLTGSYAHCFKWPSFHANKQWCSRKPSPCISSRIQNIRTEVIHALQHCCCTKPFTDKWCAVFVCMIKCYSLKKWSTANIGYRLKRFTFTLILCKYVSLWTAMHRSKMNITFCGSLLWKPVRNIIFDCLPHFGSSARKNRWKMHAWQRVETYLPTPHEFVLPI